MFFLPAKTIIGDKKKVKNRILSQDEASNEQGGRGPDRSGLERATCPLCHNSRGLHPPGPHLRRRPSRPQGARPLRFISRIYLFIYLGLFGVFLFLWYLLFIIYLCIGSFIYEEARVDVDVT
jgi:hypothetical protein